MFQGTPLKIKFPNFWWYPLKPEVEISNPSPTEMATGSKKFLTGMVVFWYEESRQQVRFTQLRDGSPDLISMVGFNQLETWRVNFFEAWLLIIKIGFLDNITVASENSSPKIRFLIHIATIGFLPGLWTVVKFWKVWIKMNLWFRIDVWPISFFGKRQETRV